MTYKDKAEQYVREKLPELMELTAGCRIGRLIRKGKNKGKYLVGTICEDTGWLSVVHWSGNRVAKIEMVEAYEIIGHPIQLQHWLSVLSTVVNNDDERFENYLEEWNSHFFEWRFGDEENTYSLKFNLATGQPATEADYKAFCEIVGLDLNNKI